ncbi:MAG: ion transporter [Proteobacteria bacterium]|nr:ion transporter [Pseudomonadota bacterium]
MRNFQTKLRLVLQKPIVDRFIMGLIAFNAVTLGLETSDWVMSRAGSLLLGLDRIILAVFVIELAARMIADFRGFWRDPWRIFDFIIVSIALVPTAGAFSVLRAFRILRVLRLLSTVEAMRRVVSGLLAALPGMGSILLLLCLIFYVFAVISTNLFAATFPEWFGSIGASAYTLFQIMTLESWSMGIVRPVMEEFPYAWALFVPFIIATAFTVLNLFIGVIVDAMQSEHASEAHAERDAMKNETEMILKEVRALRAEVAEMKAEK